MDISFSQVLEGGGVILSLPRYVSRFQYTKEKLEAVGFQALVPFWGVDGFEADLGEVAKGLGFAGTYDEEIRSRPGHIACTLSHISIWKKIVDEELPFLLIFEDDALPHPQFRELGERWWAETPGDVDMVLLGNQMEPSLLNPENRVVRVPAFCLHAYIVTQKGARRLLELVGQSPVMKMNDIQVMEWMSEGLLDFVCWNGVGLEKGYPVFKQHTPLEEVLKHSDMIVERRDTGLIYQNFCLGHTLAEKRAIYNIVIYN
jgi:hypothetical protein